MSQPTLTIDLDAIAVNWRALNALSGAAETAAAVKADGYGCGVEEVAGTLVDSGCRTFFVATLEEGIRLNAATPDLIRGLLTAEGGPGSVASTAKFSIYILNGVATEAEAAEAKAHGLRPCLNHLGQIEAWRAVGGGPCALQLDSGMSRLGLPPGELAHVPEGLDLGLILSHLSGADEPDHPSNAEQRERFLRSAASLTPVAPSARLSLGATGGTLLGEDYHFDLVRCGIGLYGGRPFLDAQPVVSLNASILQIREIPAGQSVGYGWTHTVKAPARIAALPLGYADGMHRALSNRGTVFIGGKPAPIAGRVSMDLITIDITGHDAEVGDPVEIIGPNQSIDDLATAAATIGYEILTSLGSRYARRYKGGQSTSQEP